jgi:lysophospholipase L1-like esterase
MRRALPLLLVMLLASWPAAAVSTTTKSSSSKKKKKKPAAPKVTPQQRQESSEAIAERLAEAGKSGIQNPAALIPFFERLQRNTSTVRVLHYGDSHTASDDWAQAVRVRMQEKFSVGGPGFTHAGRPFVGYRRWDSKATMSAGWTHAGLLSREGDGLYGISGVRIEASRAGESVTLQAEGSDLEVYYWRQPGGGALRLSDGDEEVARIETAGEEGPGYTRWEGKPGAHLFQLTTLSAAPVRLFGWVLENPHGATWETLGINGAQADQILYWNDALLQSQIRERAPALIVLAYGTNEARKPDWDETAYREQFRSVLARFRASAPGASILVIGPPDQAIRSSGGMHPPAQVDSVLAAQRDAALQEGCAFWNLRATMGGRGSMTQWVQAGLAQGDYVHFTAEGYRRLGDTLFDLLMEQYRVFESVRRQLIGSKTENGTKVENR